MKKIITLLLSLAIAIVFSACSNLQENSSATETTHSTFTSTYSEFENSEETISTNEASEEPTTFSSQDKISSEPPPTISTNQTSLSDTPKVVQRADPETGISWDGISPIIYTYPDGTTGTEKRNGATYEQFPGIINTVVEVEYAEYDGKCSDCGKIEGDGLNGTCLQYWAGGGNECYNCGVFVPEDTCHTCTSGCRYCGKPMGNGQNGTCYRDYFNPTNCPSCGASVPTNTCHTCGQ